MTNKDYKRLTVYNEELQIPCMTADFNEEADETIAKHVQRLCELENAIENDTLVFLPCKVGDEFWWIFQAQNPFIVDERVQSIEISERGIVIIDTGDEEWQLSRLYFTKEAAEKALEELKECKPLQ